MFAHNVTTMWGTIIGWTHFRCTQRWDHVAPSSEHVDYIQNMPPKVIRMCFVIAFKMYLKCDHFFGSHFKRCRIFQCVQHVPEMYLALSFEYIEVT